MGIIYPRFEIRNRHVDMMKKDRKTYIVPQAEVRELDSIAPVCVSGRNVGLSQKEATSVEVLIESRDMPSGGLMDNDHLW